MVDMMRLDGTRGHSQFIYVSGIDAQYTMPGTPQQNDIGEKRNHTLLDTVRSMLANSSFPNYLWERL